MNKLTTSLKALLAVVFALTLHTAHAQNNPVASALVMSSLMPVAKLNAAPAPEENAHFYDDSCKDLGHSLAWIQEANVAQPTYWNLYTEARIHLKMKNYPAALATALRAKSLAQNATNPAYVRLSEAVIKVANPNPNTIAANSPMASTE